MCNVFVFVCSIVLGACSVSDVCMHHLWCVFVCVLFLRIWFLLSIIGEVFLRVIWASVEIDNRFSNRQPIHANTKVDRALISPRTIRVHHTYSYLYGKQMKVLCCTVHKSKCYQESFDWLVYSIVLSDGDFKPLNCCEKILRSHLVWSKVQADERCSHVLKPWASKFACCCWVFVVVAKTYSVSFLIMECLCTCIRNLEILKYMLCYIHLIHSENKSEIECERRYHANKFTFLHANQWDKMRSSTIWLWAVLFSLMSIYSTIVMYVVLFGCLAWNSGIVCVIRVFRAPDWILYFLILFLVVYYDLMDFHILWKYQSTFCPAKQYATKSELKHWNDIVP